MAPEQPCVVRERAPSLPIFSGKVLPRPPSAGAPGLTNQTEGAEHRQPLHIGQAQLHQAERDDDTVKDVPALLEVLIGVHGDELQHHLRCEDACEDLWGGVQSLSQSLRGHRALGASYLTPTSKQSLWGPEPWGGRPWYPQLTCVQASGEWDGHPTGQMGTTQRPGPSRFWPHDCGPALNFLGPHPTHDNI